MEAPIIDTDKLNRVLEEMNLSERIVHGQILDRHESFLAAAALMSDTHLTGFTVKAMDCEVYDDYPKDIYGKD